MCSTPSPIWESKHWANIVVLKDYKSLMIIQEQLYCFQLERRSQWLAGVSATLRFRWGRILGCRDTLPQGPAKSHVTVYWNNHCHVRSCTDVLWVYELINYTDQWPPHQGRRTMGEHSGEYFGFEVREEPGSNPDCGLPLFSCTVCFSFFYTVRLYEFYI